MTSSYGDRLTAAVQARGPVCVGIDPHPALLSAWGLSADATGVQQFSRTVIEALGDRVAVFKPQSAFFEAYGSAGIGVLEQVLADIAGCGALALLDVKRGDIGSTMDAYAAAYLTDGSPLAADAITLSPYLGFGSLTGAIDIAASSGRGVYVLALTSNPEGAQVQHARTGGDRMVAQAIIDDASAINGDARGLGHVGIVAGATIGRTGADFTALNGSILAPGLGAQGAGAADLVDVFGSARRLVLPSMSREVLSAGPSPVRLRQTFARVRGEMEAALAVG
ncbi:MAG TPA: orotidine-5'-phosphate decarboxylase [Propionibacteriaceae bacterium]|nr:orotidine-5'-phosphate decarboxylase [Propionibacteriaceae bacterium]